MSRGYARSEERNQRIREGLEPLEPGERPGVVTAAAIVALAFAVAGAVATALGRTPGGDDNAVGTSVIFVVVLLIAAAGMWKAKYWAVLGFQALLALQVISTALAAMFALAGADWIGIPLAVAAGLGGWLFWKLVRALARLQMPERGA